MRDSGTGAFLRDSPTECGTVGKYGSPATDYEFQTPFMQTLEGWDTGVATMNNALKLGKCRLLSHLFLAEFAEGESESKGY